MEKLKALHSEPIYKSEFPNLSMDTDGYHEYFKVRGVIYYCNPTTYKLKNFSRFEATESLEFSPIVASMGTYVDMAFVRFTQQESKSEILNYLANKPDGHYLTYTPYDLVNPYEDVNYWIRLDLPSWAVLLKSKPLDHLYYFLKGLNQ